MGKSHLHSRCYFSLTERSMGDVEDAWLGLEPRDDDDAAIHSLCGVLGEVSKKSRGKS